MNYTSIEQSKRLLELGLNSETADMCYLEEVIEGSGCIPWRKGWTKYPVCIGDKPDESIPEPVNLPCWSFAALIVVMPKRIENYSLIIDVTNGIIEYSDGNHSKYSEELHSVQFLPNDTLIQLAYRMVCWLLENGYREKIKKSDESR